jgi:hypothetical protein
VKRYWPGIFGVALAASCGGTQQQASPAPVHEVHAPSASPVPSSPPEDEGNSANDEVEGRAAVEFCERYRLALEARDAKALLQLASPRYLDDSGTPDPNDDVSYEVLATYLDRMFNGIERVAYAIRYREVRFEKDHIVVEVTYSATFTMNGQDRKSVADAQLILERHEGSFRFLSGM